MIGMYVIIAVALIAGGAALGIVMVVTVGIRQEEKAGTLTVDSPSRAATGGGRSWPFPAASRASPTRSRHNGKSS